MHDGSILDTFLAPITKSTYGALLIISAPKWLAVHPHTPIFADSFFCLFIVPSRENSFDTGFCLTEQVLMIMRSASAIFVVVL